MDAIERIHELGEDAYIDAPFAGSFASQRGLTASGYNATQTDEGVPVETVELAVSGPAVTGDTYEANVDAMSGTPWAGVLVVEGIETGDGRKFAENAITWAEPPIALRHNIEDSHGGVATTKTVLVGRIDKIYRNPDNPLQIMGEGVFDDNGVHGREAARLVRGKFLKGISVDPDDIKDADVELIFPDEGAESVEGEDIFLAPIMMPELTLFHAGRLRAATLVDIPAFVEAQIWLTDEVDAAPAPAVVAAAHFTALSDRPWHGPSNEARLSGRMTLRAARTAFAHVNAGSGDGVAKTSARFLHHEIDPEGGIAHANLTACSSGIRAINAGRAQSITEAERRVAYDHMAQHLKSAGMVPPPYEGGEVLVASANDHLVRPPKDWFANPGFTELTPLTITDDGRVFGHGAEWGSCHVGFADACREPPVEGEHMYYRLGEVVTHDGSRVAVGHITLGTGHAPVRNITSSQAAEHYDNTGTVVAVVASGEDDYGIWVAGAMRPGVPESRVQELRASSLSGDWRRIGGQLRLVAFLAVNRPGFPVPRTAAFVSNSNQLSLVAAGIVSQEMRHIGPDRGTSLALQRIAKSIGRDPESRMAALRKRVRGE